MDILVGIDIGYSNLKVVYGSAKNGQVERKMFPATACNAKMISRSLIGGVSNEPDVIYVPAEISSESLLGGGADHEEYVVGEKATIIQGFSRELNANYPLTKSWLAMYRKALSVTGASEVSLVVLGLPVNQYNNEDLKAKMKLRCEGRHQINSKKEVYVEEVRIIPQSAGPWFDFISQAQDSFIDILEEGRVLIIDPGFYSVDTALFYEGRFFDRMSITSMYAFSKIIEEAKGLLKEAFNASPSTEKIETCIKENKFNLLISDKKVDIKSYIDRAAESVSNSAIREIMNSVRHDDSTLDMIILAGGGPEYYAHAIKEMVGKQPTKIVIPEDSVNSIALGYYRYAETVKNSE